MCKEYTKHKHKESDMLSINFNPSMLRAQNKLNTYNNILSTSLERLSTGLRINSAADDPAGYYVSQGLNSQIRGLKQAQNNIAMGSSLLSTAEGVMGNMTDMLNRLNDLALQGASTTLTDDQRAALTNEANALLEEIKKQNADTTFNGMNVFGSVSSTVTSNVGVSNVSSDVVPSGYTAIYTAEDLNNVRNKLSGRYILMADIDLSSVENWEPIGNDSTPFKGTFDGNGHVIKNLTINRPDTDCVGLFGFTNETYSEIKNLKLENVNVKGRQYVGGLVGHSYDTTAITNCCVTGSVSGDTSVGGLIGQRSNDSYTGRSAITNSYAICNVSGNEAVGGLIGRLYSSLGITNSYSASNVSGNNAVGGLIGRTGPGSKIENCYSTGSVSGDSQVGGIAGNGSRVTATNCYSKCDVSGNTNIGLISGLAALAQYTNVWADKKDSILNAFGSFGSGGTTITNSYAVEHSEFTSAEFWDKQGLDSNVWEMSCSIPPVLKGVGTNNLNWYFRESDNDFRLQVGADSDPSANSLNINTGLDLGAMAMDFSTVEGCLNASKCALAAIDAIAKRTSTVGASQNRLESASSANSIMVENLTAAYSNITDADVAEETTNYTMAQIMSDTTTALIVQTRSFQNSLLLNMIKTLV